MTAIQTYSGATNTFKGGARMTFRDSNGVPHMVAHNTNNGIVIYDGFGGPPQTGFTESATSYSASWLSMAYDIGGISAAMDVNDLIHICAITNEGKASKLRYNTYNTQTHAFGTEEVILADIGGTPSTTLLYTAIAIDSNNIPHITYSELPSIMGTETYVAMYTNRIAGSWKSPVQAHYVAGQNVQNLDIAIDSDNLPIIALHEYSISPNTYIGYIKKGNSNNATAFSEKVVDKGIDGIQYLQSTLIIKSDGAIFLLFTEVYNGPATYAYQLAYGADFSTGWTETPVNFGFYIYAASTALAGNDVYIFYEDTADNDVKYRIWNGTSLGAETTLEVGSFNSVRAKASFWVDRDSQGNNALNVRGVNNSTSTSGMDIKGVVGQTQEKVSQAFDFLGETINSFYLRMGKWNTPAGSLTLKLYTSSPEGTLLATSASVLISSYSEDTYVEFSFSSPVFLTGKVFLTLERTVGETTAAPQWNSVFSAPAGYAYLSQVLSNGSWVNTSNSYNIFYTLTHLKPPELDYVFLDETATPEVHWNALSLAAPTEWITKLLKWHNGSSWVEKPLKYHNGSTWVTKPVKANM